MFPNRIEVRYVRERESWKAVLLSEERRMSVYGPSPNDAVASLAELLELSPDRWRPISTADNRVLFEEVIFPIART